ncbi:unnamed protein product [Oreochromis niloticus]|nr:unnamed protein product [Mustela putorius furo]
MSAQLMNMTVATNNNTTKSHLQCFHKDDAFKYSAYRYTYLLVFPVALICNIGALAVFFRQSSRRNNATRCFEPETPKSWSIILVLNYVAVTFGFLIPFLTIIICYSKIIRQLTTDSSPSGTNLASKNRTRNRRRSVHLVSMVTATFLLCFLPYHLVRSLHLHAVCNRWNCNILLALQRGVVVTLCLAASNSMVNPLLYYYSTRTFRENLREAHSSLLSSRGGSIKSASMKRRNTS